MESKLMRVFSCLLLCGSLCALSACGSKVPPPQDPDFGISRITAYLPFVESVEFPAQIREGESFSVNIFVSAVLRPETTIGISTPEVFGEGGNQRIILSPVSAVTENGTSVVVWALWVREDVLPGEPDDHTVLTLLGLPPGEYLLALQTADVRENGGLQGQVEVTPSSGPLPHPNAVYREYPFTVVAAQEEE